MAIYRLLQNMPLGPEEISRLVAAYEAALSGLDLVNRSDPITRMVAREVFEPAQIGMHDPLEISALVIEALGKPMA